MQNDSKKYGTLLRLPKGVSDFKELVQEHYAFVDKTLLIKDIIHDGAKVILLTRPRRFGKTLNFSMLYHFLHLNNKQDEDLFKNLDISKDPGFCQEHQNQYPVIVISFKDVKRATYEEAYEEIAESIRQLYEAHRYLLEGDLLSESEKTLFYSLLDRKADQTTIASSIQQLSLHMAKKFNKKPIILIDEYDTPIQEAYLQNYYPEMIRLMRGILGKALKDNLSLEKAILTGITRVSQESLSSTQIESQVLGDLM